MCQKTTKSPLHRKEMKYYLNWIASLEIEEGLKARISQCLYWYMARAKWSKRAFYLASVLSIVLSASIPIINGLTSSGLSSPEKVTVSVIATLSALVVSLNALFDSREKWIRNRSSAEKLKRELALFAAKAEKYNSIQTDLGKTLAEETEKVIAEEASEWFQMQQDQQNANSIKKN